MSAPVRAVVVAFDDVLAHTHAARTEAIVQAAARHQVQLDPARVAPLVTGFATAEVLVVLLDDDPAVQRDPTLVALLTLAGARAATQAMSHGGGARVHLDAMAVARCTQYAGNGARIMVRSDSTRRDVDAVLQLAALDTLPLVTCCADDRLDGVPGERVALRAWRTMDRRLTALGIAPAQRLAIEATPSLAAIASAYVGATEVWRSSP